MIILKNIKILYFNYSFSKKKILFFKYF